MIKIFALATVVLLFMLAGCATPVFTQVPVAPAPQPTAVPATAIPQPAAVSDVIFPTGLLELVNTSSRALQFNTDNTFYVLADGNRVVEGTYSIKGNVYTETSNSVDCPSQMEYTFTFDGFNLKFAPVADPAKDPCDGRKTDFNVSKTWVLRRSVLPPASVFPTGLFELMNTPNRGLQFNEDNTFYVLADGNHVVEGTYSIKDNVYTETSNSVDCPSQMDFTFTFDGVYLKFKPVADPANDPCDGRKTDFNDSKTWILRRSNVPAAVAQPTAAEAGLFPTGLFELKDTPARGLQFNKDNTFFVLADGNHVVEGTYSTKDNVYTETSNSVDCPSQMDFTFTFDGTNLTFAPVADPAKDPCDGRKTDFNDSKTWVLMH